MSHHRPTHICAGIKYDSESGPVYLDLCGWSTHDAQWRSGLHDALNEWLDKGEGSGIFFVGERESLQEEP